MLKSVKDLAMWEIVPTFEKNGGKELDILE